MTHLKVGHRLQLGMLGGVEVLLSHHDSLLEQVFVDHESVLLGHQHGICLVLLPLKLLEVKSKSFKKINVSLLPVIVGNLLVFRITISGQTDIKLSELQQADGGGCVYQQIPGHDDEDLGHQGGGGGALVLEGGGQDSLGLVVPEQESEEHELVAG